MRISPEAMKEVRRALESYREEVSCAGLAERTVNTYLHHAETFVRWLNHDFTPGCRVQKL